MHHTRTLGWGLIAAALLTLAGCASSRSSVTVQESTKLSKGQELNDLIRAKQAGALTDDEFESLRQTIMKRPN
jgi:oligoribonuclease NrnB/cAMP/cGMP phosphodiesterase (DHH superfamily)